jgi:hypothetical protein
MIQNDGKGPEQVTSPCYSDTPRFPATTCHRKVKRRDSLRLKYVAYHFDRADDDHQ